ncbi:MAG: serine hydrolase [Saprospiraceae bacterium]|nr:serine hydrolase [Saprospiraceae bacterium]
MRTFIFCLLSLSGIANVQGQSKEVDKIIDKEVSKSKTPSIQYVIFDAENILYEKRSGLADVNILKPTTKNTAYSFYSITKTFTALAVLQLVESGDIEMDEPASRYLPDFPYSTQSTVRQLLSHSAGIPNPMPLGWIHLEEEHNDFKQKDFFKSIFEEHSQVKSQPNEKFSYSNLGYVLLGQIIEHISGMTYEKYVEENILKKFQIENEIAFSMGKNQAIGYQKRRTLMNFVLSFLIDKSKFMDKGVGKWKPFKKSYVNGQAYGGLIGTANGLVTYLQEFLKPDSRLVTQKQKRLLFTENYTNNDKSTGMCLSWFKGKIDGKEYFTHAGGGGGYYSEVRIYPGLGIGSVLLTNRSGMKDERFLDALDVYYIEQGQNCKE